MNISLLVHFALASQVSLGIVFLLSALPKLRRPVAFLHSVVDYQVLPAHAAAVFGAVLIPLELFLALALLTGLGTNIALPLATVLLLIFLAAIGINLWRGRKIACGCFGNAREPISLRTVARLLLLLTVVLLLIAFRSVGLVSLPSALLIVGDRAMFISLLYTIFLAVFLILLGAWMLNLPELVMLVRHWCRIQPSSDNTQDRVEGA